MSFIDGLVPPPKVCRDCLVRRQALFTPLDEGALDQIQEVRSGRRRVEAGGHIHPDGDETSKYMTLHSGWAMRCRSVEDGRTQIANFLLPGSFIDVSFEDANGDRYWIEAITDTYLCTFSGQKLRDAFGAVPDLSRSFTMLCQREQALLMEHLTDLGRREAIIRVAHFLLETFTRLRLLGQVEEDSCPFPLKQHHLADALGLSIEHVNRMIRDLRERQWISIKGPRLHLHDIEAMSHFCDFNPGYLKPRPII